MSLLWDRDLNSFKSVANGKQISLNYICFSFQAEVKPGYSNIVLMLQIPVSKQQSGLQYRCLPWLNSVAGRNARDKCAFLLVFFLLNSGWRFGFFYYWFNRYLTSPSPCYTQTWCTLRRVGKILQMQFVYILMTHVGCC